MTLSEATLFELVVEAIYGGVAKSVNRLSVLEPIAVEEIFLEFTRRSGTRVSSVEDCVSWFRGVHSGATDDERWQFEEIVKLKALAGRMSKP